MAIAVVIVLLVVVLFEQRVTRKEIRHMGERLTQDLNDIEQAIVDLTTSEAAEDADAAAAKQQIAELEARIAELEARETISEDDLVRIEGLKQKLADIKAGAQAEAAKRGKKK